MNSVKTIMGSFSDPGGFNLLGALRKLSSLLPRFAYESYQSGSLLVGYLGQFMCWEMGSK